MRKLYLKNVANKTFCVPYVYYQHVFVHEPVRTKTSSNPRIYNENAEPFLCCNCKQYRLILCLIHVIKTKKGKI